MTFAGSRFAAQIDERNNSARQPPAGARSLPAPAAAGRRGAALGGIPGVCGGNRNAGNGTVRHTACWASVVVSSVRLVRLDRARAGPLPAASNALAGGAPGRCSLACHGVRGLCGHHNVRRPRPCSCCRYARERAHAGDSGAARHRCAGTPRRTDGHDKQRGRRGGGTGCTSLSALSSRAHGDGRRVLGGKES